MISKNLLLTALIWLWIGVSLTGFAQQTENYKRVKIYTNQAGMEQLNRLGLPLDHIEHKPGAWVIGEFSASELELINTMGYVYDVLIPDMSAYYQAQNKTPQIHAKQGVSVNNCTPQVSDYATPQGFNLGSMGGFYTYTQMLAHLDTMFSRFPNLISSKQPIEGFITAEGNQLKWVKISDNPQTDEPGEPQILFNALHHAREPVSLSQLIFFMYYLLENYETDTNIQYLVNNTEIYFIPCVNPDGYLWNEFTNPNGGGMWRKNRNPNFDGTFGVDPNRNYGFMWGIDDSGSSPSTNSGTYRGPAPFSEPEIQAVKAFCEQKQLQMAFNNHSHGNLLLYPWGYQPNSETPDSTLFRAFAQELILENSFRAGTAIQTVGYLANGSSDDWMYGEQETKNKIYSFTPEIGNSFVDGFWPSDQRIAPLCKSMMWHNLTALRLLHNYAIVTDISPQFYTTLNPQIPIQIQRIGLTQGTFTLTVEPLTPNISAYPAAAEISSLQLEETVILPLVFELNTSTGIGEPFSFNLHLSNGQGYVLTQTITKYTGQPTPVFTTDGTDLTIWQTNPTPNAWGISNSDFVSAPSSITDSPDGDYTANAYTELTLLNPIDLTGYTYAQLRFWAKWNIEKDYDFVQVQAITPNGTATPLCGKFTKPGTPYQLANEPLYDGYQPTWVPETIDLTPFIGETITLRFVLHSDEYISEDGFYFDDLIVETLTYQPDDTTTTAFFAAPNEPVDMPLLMPCHPNPAISTVVIPYYLPQSYTHSNLQLIVTNAIGKQIHTQTLPPTSGAGSIELPLHYWQPGLYFYYLHGNSTKTPTRKLMVCGSAAK